MALSKSVTGIRRHKHTHAQEEKDQDKHIEEYARLKKEQFAEMVKV